jgi:hypothetical protein
MGEKFHCEIHGECILWATCEHINKRKANRIILSKSKIVICLPCAMKLNTLKTSPLTAICDGCLRDFVKQLLKNVEAEEEIKKAVIGLENLGGKDGWS